MITEDQRITTTEYRMHQEQNNRQQTNNNDSNSDHIVRKKYENKLGKLKLQFEATFTQKHMFQKQQPKAGHTNQNTKKIST